MEPLKETPLHSRGQVTIYLILAVFVILVSLSIWRTQRVEQTTPAVLSAAEPATIATEVITGCLTQALEESLTNLGNMGNADAPPRDLAFFDDHSVAILYHNRAVLLPSITQYGTQIADGAYKPFDTCMAETGKLPYQLDVDYENMVFSVTFDESSTILTADIPAVVISGEARTSLRSFMVKTPVAFQKVHAFMSDYLDEISKDPFIVPFTPLLTQDISATLFPVDSHTFLVRITDPDSFVRNQPWTIRFAIDYGSEDDP